MIACSMLTLIGELRGESVFDEHLDFGVCDRITFMLGVACLIGDVLKTHLFDF